MIKDNLHTVRPFKILEYFNIRETLRHRTGSGGVGLEANPFPTSRGNMRNNREPLLSLEDVARLKAISPNPPPSVSRKRRIQNSAAFRKTISKLRVPTAELSELEQAVSKPELFKGWPDAGCTEMKIASDYIKRNQWVRFAWLKKYKDVNVNILRAATQEEAVEEKEFQTIRNYIYFNYGNSATKALSLWERLIEIVPER